MTHAGFLWGAASAAYQVEGAPDADGRGPSKWDIYTNRDRITEAVVGVQHTGNIAINAYDRRQYLEDIALMREAGIDAYRFSLSWSRIFPEGAGKANQAGLDHYRRFIDDLLAAGIAPMVTLYHWDFPWALHQKGGWGNRDSIGWFRDYAGIVFRALGDRVPRFITMNEPFYDIMFMDVIAGHVRDRKPLFQITAEEWRPAISAMHNLYVASAAAIAEFRALRLPGKIGIALPLSPASALDKTSAACAEAAGRWDTFFNRWPLDLTIRGEYADDVLAVLREIAPDFAVSDADRTLLKANTIDFLGVNFYSPHYCRHDPSRPLGVQWGLNPDDVKAFNGPVRPEELHALLIRIRDEYGNLPVFITENGAGFGDLDEVIEGGMVKDPLRTDYVRRHVEATLKARQEGADIRGYVTWSLFDNFEWIQGYTRRFGMVHVDFDTQKRIPKQSFYAYRDMIRAWRQRAAA